MNKIRNAILKAATAIEANPERFTFMSCFVPGEHDCGTPGCAIGWIGTFLGTATGRPISDVSQEMGVDELRFYRRMGTLANQIRGDCWGRSRWKHNAKLCAETLRAYADKYHPAKEEQYPEVSRELDRIFGASRASEAPA